MTQTEERPTKTKEKPKEDEKVVDLSAQIALALLAKLGKPRNLVEVRVVHLWDNRYRVNVWCGNNGGTLDSTRRITDSFFVYTSPEGGIVRTSPEIQKKYTPENPYAKIVLDLKDDKCRCVRDILVP